MSGVSVRAQVSRFTPATPLILRSSGPIAEILYWLEYFHILDTTFALSILLNKKWLYYIWYSFIFWYSYFLKLLCRRPAGCRTDEVGPCARHRSIYPSPGTCTTAWSRSLRNRCGRLRRMPCSRISTLLTSTTAMMFSYDSIVKW